MSIDKMFRKIITHWEQNNDLPTWLAEEAQEVLKNQHPAKVITAHCACGRQMTVTGNVTNDQPDGCREAFEAWWKEANPCNTLERNIRFPEYYFTASAEYGWQAWQAALATKRESGDEGLVKHVASHIDPFVARDNHYSTEEIARIAARATLAYQGDKP